MLNSLKMAKDILDLQREAKKLEKQMKKITAEAESKDGLVRVKASAAGDVLAIEIDDSLLNPESKQRLQKDIIEAIQKALKNAQKAAANSLMGQIGLGLG